jgi:hypothetical protein
VRQVSHLPESNKLCCLTFLQFKETDYSVHVQIYWYSKPFVDTQLHSLAHYINTAQNNEIISIYTTF